MKKKKLEQNQNNNSYAIPIVNTLNQNEMFFEYSSNNTVGLNDTYTYCHSQQMLMPSLSSSISSSTCSSYSLNCSNLLDYDMGNNSNSSNSLSDGFNNQFVFSAYQNGSNFFDMSLTKRNNAESKFKSQLTNSKRIGKLRSVCRTTSLTLVFMMISPFIQSSVFSPFPLEQLYYSTLSALCQIKSS